ncbi:MAG: hypothetical protein J6V44_08405 [Methanobrevibacter sp.]|nr:hypothetical protein [Methanobrevibacter sp.]
MIDYRYSQSEFDTLLFQFRSAIECGEYTEKIPYETWRKLKKLAGPFVIEYESPFVRIKSCFICIDGTETWDTVYSAKTYDWGFGRFFYDEVIKKERNKDMTLNSANSATFTCNTADINRNVWDQLTGTSIDTATLETKADYMSYYDYDSDSTTGCPNYGTTTNHTIKINGDSLSSNSLYITKDDYNGIWGGAGTAVTNISTIGDRVNVLESQMEQLMNENKKENDTMMKGINFDFGPCGNTVRLSMYGMAIQNISGEWVSYNPDSREIINVDVFNMADGGKYMYKMPVAIADVKEGDIVIHNRVPMFVTAINENGTFEVTDVRAGETKNIIPTRNMFGFNFMTKVVSLFGAFTDAPTADQPFGNMLPFLMMGDNKDIDPMMMFFMMGQGGTNVMANPMMMYFMMKDNKDFDPMLMFMMMNQNHTCNCGKHVEKPDVQK